MSALGARKSSIRLALEATLGVLLLGLIIYLAGYLTSPQFHEWVRGRLIAHLEDVLGGKVEMQSFAWDLSRLEFVASDLTIHGTEASNEIPYVHVDRLVVRLKILSLVRREIGLQLFQAERPVIHLIIYPDGHTNQPTPKAVYKGKPAPVQRLFELAVERTELREGVFLLNDRPIPFDVIAHSLAAAMDFVPIEKRYDGAIQAGAVSLRYAGAAPLGSSAEAQFSLFANRLQLKALKWGTGRSRATVSGQIANFRNPEMELHYEASLDVPEVGSFTRIPELPQGTLELAGDARYGHGRFSSTGKLVAKRVELRSPDLRIPEINFGAMFTVDEQRLLISNLFASLLGGTVVGNAEIRNWMSAQVAPEQQGIAHLRLNALSAGRAAEAVSTAALPLNRLNPVGAAGGRIDVSWKGKPSRAWAEFALDINSPPQVGASQMPISAVARGRYGFATETLELEELNLVARSLRLNATGQTGPASTELRVSANVGDLRDLDPVIAAMRIARPLPPQVSGKGTFGGTVSGRLTAPNLVGHLQLSDFSVPVQPSRMAPQAAAEAPRTVRFDQLAADVQYSPVQVSAVNGILRRGASQAEFRFSLALQNGAYSEAGPLTARLNIRDFELSDLQALAGYNYPIAGLLNASVQLAGSAAAMQGGGRIEVKNARLFGESVPTLSTDLALNGREVQLRNLALSQNGGRLAGSASYDLKTTAFRFDAQGTGFDLARVQHLQSKKLTTAGKMDFKVQGAGTKDVPRVNAELHLRDLVLNEEAVGQVDAQIVTNDDQMRISAHSKLVKGEAELNGSVCLRDQFPAKLDLRLAGVDVDPLLQQFLKGRVTGHSSLSGGATLEGPLRDTQRLAMNAEIGQFTAEVENIRLHNEGPLRFRLAQQVLQVEQFRLAGDATHIGVSGTASLAGQRELNLRAEGNVDLRLLQAYEPKLNSAGRVEFAFAASGTLRRPVLRGQARIGNGAIALIDLPNGLSDINGTLIFNQEGMQIQSLTARTGGGNVSFGGFATYADNLLRFNVTALGKEIRVRYPQGISSVVNADLRLTGTTQNATLAGDITITKVSMGSQFDLALALARSRQAVEAPNPRSPLGRLHLDLHVTSTPELQVQSSLARVSGQVDLQARGVANRPALLGRINLAEGEVNFNGTKYRLERGDISFANPVGIDPVMDVELTTRVRDYDVTLGFHGKLNQLGTTYRSDPPLPTSDIIALLAFGRTSQETTVTGGTVPSFTETASNAILGEALNMAVSSRVQRLFGVSRIKIAPEVGGGETSPNAKITIEQQVSQNVTFTYISDIAHSTQPIISVEYNINRQVSVVAARDQNGVVSFEVRLRQRKK